MQTRKFIGSALLAVGLMMTGCGGVPAEGTEQTNANLSTREDELPDCTGQNYETTYYSDATYASVVGSRGCSCGAYFRWGVTSSYSEFYDYGACW